MCLQTIWFPMLSLSSSPPPPLSIIAIRTVINETVARCPERTALGIKRDGVWVTWSYRQITKFLHGSINKDGCKCKSLYLSIFLNPFNTNHFDTGNTSRTSQQWRRVSSASASSRIIQFASLASTRLNGRSSSSASLSLLIIWKSLPSLSSKPLNQL